MPQMSPLSWLNLFFLFITIYVLINSVNYFSFKYTPKTSKNIFSKIKTNWKW